MSVKEKLLACLLAALFVLAIVGVYAVLVVQGKTDVNPLLVLLSSLVTAVVGWVSGMFGHVSATSAAAQAAGLSPESGTQSNTVPPSPGAGAAAAPLPTGAQQ